MRLYTLAFAALLFCGSVLTAPADEKPIRALLITGGCCHDYAHQKKILTEGISARANVVWSIVHEGDGTTDHKLSVYEDPDWAKNFDVVVHDECFADVKDAAFVRGILKPHQNGLPAVNLHCAMHCYRVDFEHFKEWFEFTGLDSRSHGAQLPIALSYTATNHPILTGLTDWSTGPEELYNNVEIWKTTTPLIYGQQGNDKNLVAWVNDYRGTRVFSTTLGHNNSTVSDSRYLDLVTRGLLWSVNKLDKEHLKPAAATRKAQKMVRVPINLALRKKASSSGSQDGHPPEHAVDADSETRWCAPDNGNNYWWQVDLGQPQDITGVRIEWEKENAAYEYQISGSADDKTWKVLVEGKSGLRPQVDEQKFSADQIRYVRITVTKAPPGSWASFFECEVLGKEMVERPATELSESRLAGVQAPAGFEQTLFAGPPNISYPTCLEATPSGDVFVGVDQNGSLDREKDRGWVVRCRDTNGDGVADQFVTFAKMDSPRGIVFDNNTLYVMHPPLLEAFHDDNGDGIADRSEVLVRGLANDLNFRGADHTCNGLRMGIDGWFYIALGDYGALKAVAKDGSTIQLHGGGIVRVRPDGSDLEVVVQGTRNIYDVAIDPFMNLFTCDNTNDGDDWNVRLSHMIPTANYGYPSLFKNFSNEIMPTMHDFGGGSPTGSLFLDEPGFPDDFGNGLYTCQWGWNNISRHPLKRSGATFGAEKETFLRIPRPTGIAADGLGNLYVASWKGATFNYAGPNAGFVVRVSSLNNQTKPLPNVAMVSDTELTRLLASSSATQRLHVQREILRRSPHTDFTKSLGQLATSSTNLAVRSAAIFTLGQIESASASKLLFNLSKDSTVREFVFRALADSKVRATSIPSKFFVDALEDKNPAVCLQAVVALNRLHRTETAKQLFSLTLSSDPAVSHAAFRALVSFRATKIAFDALDKNDKATTDSALKILSNIPEKPVVEGLIKRFRTPARTISAILEVLCRLYYREADWDGSWWTTRPDTSGPYYKPVAWEATPQIDEVLRNELERHDPKATHRLLLLSQKYKIELPNVSASALEGLVRDTSLQPNTRKKAFQNIQRISNEAAVHALLACVPGETVGTELRKGFVSDLQRVKEVEAFTRLASTGSQGESELAFEVLLQIESNPNALASAKMSAQQTILQHKDSPALLAARATLPKPITEKKPDTSAVTIGKLSYDDAVKQVGSVSGDAKVGEKLFETVGCIKCHTVSKSDAPKGPFLGDITARYSAAEILESILRPSAKIAQGFETTSIERKDGESIDGFVVRESGDEIELRNLAGTIIIPKKDVATRGTRKTSIMPHGLADGLTPRDMASLLRYLDSMRAKN